MDDDKLIHELERISGLEDISAQAARGDIVQTIKERAGWYQQSGQHWLGISLLSRARQIMASPELDRMMALVFGGKAELVLKWADGLRIVPSPGLLDATEEDLREAIRVDAALPDPFWDLAVISARYRGDCDAAARHLETAKSLGYRHPMMQRLEMLIQARPPVQAVRETPETALRQLVLDLAVHATGPQCGTLLDENESHDPPLLPHVGGSFGDYVTKAKAFAGVHAVSEEEYLSLLADSAAIGGDSGEFVTDLLRRLAGATTSSNFLERSTDRHLQILRQSAFDFFERRKEDEHWIRRSRRAAQRGLEIIKGTQAPVDPDLHADLLIARGQALYYEKENYAIEAIRCYQQALGLKRGAGNSADVEKLKDILWRQIDHRLGRALLSRSVAGIGEALEVFTVCAEVAEELEDPLRALRIKLQLATLRREIGQREEAETLLREILAGGPSAEVARAARFELASVYSETSRPREAADLQKQLLDESETLGSEAEPTLWSNYANSLRLLGDTDGARLALDKAWHLLPPEQKAKVGNTVPAEGARIRTLQAQLALETDNNAAALEYLDAAGALDPTPIGLSALHYYETKARCLMAAGHMADAKASLATALHNFKFLISHGPSLPSWESLLRQWSRLDVMAVRANLESGENDGAQNALLRAESAKGRVLAWLERRLLPEGAEWALGLERQHEALKKAQEWLKKKPGRRVVSLFGSDRGLGVFDVGDQGSVRGAWLDDFNYDQFRLENFEPWEDALDQALNKGTLELERRAQALTEGLLDSVGAWLERAQPALVAGGENLLIIPHRLFRNLPITHARLPSVGRRLSELFKTVTVAPSLSRFGDDTAASANDPSKRGITACADADGSLPFARCEALLCAGTDRALVGAVVTGQALREAFQSDGALLLSLHGEFNRENPFQSLIHTADGSFPLHEAFLRESRTRAQTVVLGVCEAGRSRRSLSDEPLGFPALFLQAGASLVLAPLWEVDDFASFLFVTKVFDATASNAGLPSAVSEAAVWLREASAAAILSRVAFLLERLRGFGEAGREAITKLDARLNEQKEWLETLHPSERPFASPLDWMAFQITGIPAGT
jgi:tetratricopeptide (TPR) repeat protein